MKPKLVLCRKADLNPLVLKRVAVVGNLKLKVKRNSVKSIEWCNERGERGRERNRRGRERKRENMERGEREKKIEGGRKRE